MHDGTNARNTLRDVNRNKNDGVGSSIKLRVPEIPEDKIPDDLCKRKRIHEKSHVILISARVVNQK